MRPNGPSSAKRLDVKPVRVAHPADVRRLMGEEVPLVRPGTGAEQGVLPGIVPREAPQVPRGRSRKSSSNRLFRFPSTRGGGD